ncbi:MAG: hypothetical protein U0T07_07000 [Chitinophagales bacterium]
MKNTPVQIVVIHDDIMFNPDNLVKSSPIMVALVDKFGLDNVILFTHSQQGLDYVLENLGKKMVVLLDKNFYDGREKSGIQVFEEIREQTSLVYVILTSVGKLTDIDEDSLKTLINNELFGFENFTSDYTKIVNLIERAVNKLNVRVDAVLEEWILRLDDSQREKPYIKLKDGTHYTLNDIVSEIRKESEFGIDMQRKILNLTIDLLTRQRTSLDD